MASFDLIEQDIVNRLAPMAAVPGIEVVLLPETQADFERAFENVRITVAYAMSDFGEEGNIKSMEYMVQEESLHFEVIVVARKMRGPGGILNCIDLIRKYLVGFRPVHCGTLYLVKQGIKELDQATALWRYSMIFRGKGLLVEDVELPTEPVLQQLLIIEDNNNN